LRGEEFDALVEDIKKKGLILPIILYDGMVVDGKNRLRACLKINVPPVTMDYKGKLSAIDLVTSLNSIRRSDSPAAKAEIAKRIMDFLEDEEEEARIEEALKEQDELTAEKIRFVREKKKLITAAEMAGTTSETLKKGMVIEKMAETDPELAEEWEIAKKKKKSVSTVYDKTVQRQEGSEEMESEEESLVRKKPILAEINEKLRTELQTVREEVKEWRDKYHNLKAVYETLEQKYNELKSVLKTAFESAGLESTPAKKEKGFPKVKDLREAELKY